MSINTNMDTITVNDVEYDVEREEGRFTKLTLSLDGEPVFEGLEGTLGYEEDAGHDSPRDWSNVGTISVHYPRYNLGDEDIDKIDFEITCGACHGMGEVGADVDDSNVECPACKGEGSHTLDPADYFRQECGARVVIGLFVYEHSGITMSAGPTVGPKLKQDDIRSTGRFMGDDAGWDTSFVGFTYDTPEGVKQCLGENATDEEIEAALRGEVATYASYLEGDVTWFSVSDDETNFMEGCGGFVGCHKDCESECFSAMEQAITARLAEIEERKEWAARDTVTI